MNNKTQTMEVVALTDPAIDLTKTDLREYADTRDLSLVVPKQGMQCTRYYLKPLSLKVFNRMVKPASVAVRYERAFCFSCVQADNLTGRNGQRFDTWTPTGRTNIAGISSGEELVTDDELELFWPNVVDELGAVAWRMSFLQPGSDETWQLPPSLLAEYMGIFRSAEQIRQAHQSLSDKQQPDSPKNSSESSAKDTPATATA